MYDPFHRRPSERSVSEDDAIREVKKTGELMLSRLLLLQARFPSGGSDFEIARQKIHEAVFWMNKGITE